ncbi:hypothetical protein KC19_5G067300 [Ceratodon purpureus]|uniref:COBRA C-terminal domain-containing protein n=1 Tax=Ceratodon purpureus TaxID=3225 RepID=A0A8T0I129_CERPU|nr:hypothetical protein KC19_5G067300 [Ceratodon purpureus]
MITMARFDSRTILLFTLVAISVTVNAQPIVVTKPPAAAPLPPTAAPLPPTAAPLPPSTAFSPAPEPAPLWPICDGVDVVYVTTFTEKIYPFLNDTPWLQPYKFESVVTVTNMGYRTVEGWGIGINYTHHEILVAATGGMVLENGQLMPVDVSNGTILTQIPVGVLKNAIETAGDISQIQKTFAITGTEFGKKLDPMPSSINITVKGYNCSEALLYGNNTMHTCCSEPPSNVTLTDEEFFLPSERGNFTITYDVQQAYTGSYLALVTISNDSPLTKLDFWNLSWTWQENEFITTMKGATTRKADRDVCLNGIAGQTYTTYPDLNTVLCCSTSPEIIDLPLEKYNDTQVGLIEYCCRNGTIWPAVLEPKKSKSAFILNVMKVPPFSNKLNHITPPGAWRIGDGRFQCGTPRRIKPTVYSDPYLLHDTSAFKTWQITCNETVNKPLPKCCVSFSKYNNESIVPCPTCACGCPAVPDPATPVCDATAPAMLLPYSAISMNPLNRSNQILAWASLRHRVAPDPLPCMDYCGVNINWHIVSNFTGGWSARMTLFDWSNTTFADWFTVLEMPKVYAGFEKAYSFNAFPMPLLNDTTPNTSIIAQGMPGFNNYLMAQTNLSAGKLQSVFSFTKKKTPGIGEDAYWPQKVYFNGEECAMPDFFPVNGAVRQSRFSLGLVMIAVVLTVLLIL